MEQMNLANLRNQISTSFNKGELRTLCFDLDIKYENLPGETLEDKARELVAFCQRRGNLQDLIKKCRELRPQESWSNLADSEFEKASSAPPSSPEKSKLQSGLDELLVHTNRKQLLFIVFLFIIIGFFVVKPLIIGDHLRYGDPVELETNQYQVKLAGNEAVVLFNNDLEIYFDERDPGTVNIARGSLVPDIGKIDVRSQGFPRQTFSLGLGEYAAYETDDIFTILVTDIYFPDSDFWGRGAYVELVIAKEQ